MRQHEPITTVEGLARGDRLHPVQDAFVRHDAFQCGACTPGQIMSAVAVIEEGHTRSDEEIREWMSGNLCRCARLPAAGFSAASITVPSVGAAVSKAARVARDAVVGLAVAAVRCAGGPDRRRERLPVRRCRPHAQGQLLGRRVPARPACRRDRGAPQRARVHTGAIFVEVRVNPRLGRVRVVRAVRAYDLGRLTNPMTARGQVPGGVIWGIGFALMESTALDPNTGRMANQNFSQYLVPVNADAPPQIDAISVDRPDARSPIGAKGFGETPVTGVPAAIGNAIFHATGRRLRELPFTADKLL